MEKSVDDAVSKVKEHTDDFVDDDIFEDEDASLEDDLSDLAEDAQKTADDLKDKAKDMVSDLKDKAEEAVEDIKKLLQIQATHRVLRTAARNNLFFCTFFCRRCAEVYPFFSMAVVPGRYLSGTTASLLS